MSRSHITSHVLDAALGVPARDVMIRLERGTPATSASPGEAADGAPSLTWEQIGSQRTDEDGRTTALGPSQLDAGTYRLTVETGEYFAAADRPTFYPQVVLVVDVADADQHYHVPVLLSPFAYTTYRGS